MKFVAVAVTLASLTLSAPLLADKPKDDAQETSTESSEEAEKPKKICRAIRTDASSRRKERVCLTREQWREFNRGQ